MEEADFWDNPRKSQEVLKEAKGLKDIIEEYESLKSNFEDAETLLELAYEEEEESLISEIEDTIKFFEEKFEALRLNTLLSGRYDKYNGVLTLHAGAGGQESSIKNVSKMGGQKRFFCGNT